MRKADSNIILARHIHFKPHTIILILLILLGLGFLPLFSVIKEGAYLVFLVFPLIAGWLLGFRLGLLYWVFHCTALSFLSIAAGKPMADFFPRGIITYILSLLFAAGMGKISDLGARLHRELKERERIEKELRQYKEHLEGLVAHRTRELLKSTENLKREMAGREKVIERNKKLEDSLKMAEKMEAIGTLAGGIAHDFNNLLMGIQGRVSLMALDMDSAGDQREHLKAIEDYVHHATSLTNQLLGFARGGKYEVKPFDISKLLASSADLFGRTRKEIQIHIKTELAKLIIEADPRQIEQVLLNLYINAWQAMPDGGDLYLETATVFLDEPEAEKYNLKPGPYGKLSVTDTGIGMDDAIQNRIFDPFFTTKDKSRGTGLGLASAYGIVKNHGGMITVRSTVGRGATFTVFLPVSEKRPNPENPTHGELKKGSEVILLVDDEQMILDVTQAMMVKLGYQVVIAKSGKEAIAKVNENGDAIHLVVLDLIMPGMDGMVAFEKIRALRPQIPIILSSGYAINGKATEIMRRGCNGFIQKPFKISALSQKIRQILDEAEESAAG